AAFVAVSALSVLALSGGGVLYAAHAHALRAKAESAREDAREQEAVARRERAEAEAQRKHALEQEGIAKEKRAEAEQERRRAEAAEVAERARADSEARAKERAQRLQKDTAGALDHLAALFNDFGRLDLRGGQRQEALRAFREACELLEGSEAT